MNFNAEKVKNECVAWIKDFFEKNKGGEFFYFTTKAINRHTDVKYPDNAYLVFGGYAEGIERLFQFEAAAAVLEAGQNTVIVQNVGVR